MIKYDDDAIEYIAKIADGGMRDAITMLDKCLAYSSELTLENVVNAIGAVDYDTMFGLTKTLIERSPAQMLKIVDHLHAQGKDLKLFLKSYTEFVLDLCKYDLMQGLEYTKIPTTYLEVLHAQSDSYFKDCQRLLKLLMQLNSSVKWETNPKAVIEANFYQFCLEE